MNPLHSEYCNCECPAGNSYDKLERTLNRVRMLHVQHTRDGVTFCTHCLDPDIFDNFALWPCDTIKALQGCGCPPELVYKGDHFAECEAV